MSVSSAFRLYTPQSSMKMFGKRSARLNAFASIQRHTAHSHELYGIGELFRCRNFVWCAMRIFGLQRRKSVMLDSFALSLPRFSFPTVCRSNTCAILDFIHCMYMHITLCLSVCGCVCVFLTRLCTCRSILVWYAERCVAEIQNCHWLQENSFSTLKFDPIKTWTESNSIVYSSGTEFQKQHQHIG